MRHEGYKIARVITVAAVMFIVIFGAGCDIKNNNKITCKKDECTATCIEKGYESGACSEKEGCVCSPTEGEPHKWTGTGEENATTDTYTDTNDLDAGDTESESETESDTVVSDAGDTESSDSESDSAKTDDGETDDTETLDSDTPSETETETVDSATQTDTETETDTHETIPDTNDTELSTGATDSETEIPDAGPDSGK